MISHQGVSESKSLPARKFRPFGVLQSSRPSLRAKALKLSLEDLRALPQQRLRVDFNESLPNSEAIKPVLGELVISASASGAQVAGRIQTLLKLSCHSCLRPFFKALDLNIDERFVYEDYLRGENKDNRERELLKEDFVEAIPYAGVIDISDVVYQAVTLATPTYCSCGPDCPGPPKTKSEMPARKWVADNGLDVKPKEVDAVDPRWKNLKTLFSNDDS
jgi:uncharacterized metal-binding protein YceD (DUF177 family)